MYRFSTLAMGGLVLAWLTLTVVGVEAQNPGGNPAARAVKNPVAPTAASVTAGMQLYQKNCQFCHGPKGLGDGPLAPKDTMPANLVDEKWDRGSTDGEIFAVIETGAGPDFKMKGVKGRIATNDIWNIVNYLRSIGPKTATR
jgi:mono/diheme cytochrome c family protein